MKKRLLGFLCQWCGARALEHLSYQRRPLPAGFYPIRVPCSGSVAPEVITQALASGASGVLVVGCPPGQCHFREGNQRCAIRMRFLKGWLKALGVSGERIRLALVGAGEGEKLYQIVWDFWEDLGEDRPL
ncbi:hydrogenase iron-sulfur subunit [Thermosulfurimonas marina]|uniref:Hydrogenase iron-sulfur subunit n=1 Tax=Thermosulfurimonas marina TaxID=2047767 RepID=A0A6H1WSN4_9BACT|nr:hydrogenase iron-sulfur subunit [Thermosulfurimonas marina]QJA06164.1 hydrogenase iron-sulfur subunit [Thermosulfurimonas marina]